MPDEKRPPNNVEAEKAVLGGCFVDNDALPTVAGLLAPEDFYDERLRALYETFLALHEAGQPVDPITLEERLDGSYDPLLMLDCQEAARYVSASVEGWAGIVAEKATRRRMLDAAGEVARLAHDEANDLGDAQDEAAKAVLGARGRDRRDARPLKQLAVEYFDHVELLAKGGVPLGIPTGFMDLDALLGGLHKSDLIVLAARPSVGKSALSHGITRNVARLGHHVAFFSLEMSASQVTQRLVALDSAVPMTRLKEGKLQQEEWPKFVQSVDALGKLGVFVDDTPNLQPTALRAKAMRLDAEHGLDLIVVDYLQLMIKDGRNLREQVTAISLALKSLARDMDLPVLALSQLSRACEGRLDKRPRLSDLRESGAIEQDADVVIFIYRDEMYDPNTECPNIAEVHVAKYRNGPTGILSLYFRKELAQFLDAEVRRQNVEDEHYQHFSNGL